MLSDVMDRGTGSAARQRGVRFPVGGKTGTTNDFKDAWFVGFSSLPRRRRLGRLRSAEERSADDAYGSRYALPIWSDFMRRTSRRRPPAGVRYPGRPARGAVVQRVVPPSRRGLPDLHGIPEGRRRYARPALPAAPGQRQAARPAIDRRLARRPWQEAERDLSIAELARSSQAPNPRTRPNAGNRSQACLTMRLRRGCRARLRIGWARYPSVGGESCLRRSDACIRFRTDPLRQGFGRQAIRLAASRRGPDVPAPASATSARGIGRRARGWRTAGARFL